MLTDINDVLIMIIIIIIMIRIITGTIIITEILVTH